MTAPNMLTASSVTGKLSVLAVPTTATAIVTNSASSGQVYKINILTISNVSATTSANVTVDVYRSGVAYRLCNNITIPTNASFAPIDKSSMYYLEEGDSLRITADTASILEATCSYEVVS